MKNIDLRYEVITDEQAFFALQAEWDDLWRRAKGSYYQSFAFVWIAWQQIAKPKGRVLRCIVRRHERVLAMVWPLVMHQRFLWSCLTPLCPDAADYSGMLIDEHLQPAVWIEEAWLVATRECRADIMHLPFVHEASGLYRVAAKAPSVVATTRNDAYVAKLSEECGHHDWTSFCASLDTMGEKKPGSVARRLGRKGKLDTQVIDPSDRRTIASIIDVMFEWKLNWADRVGKHGRWLDSMEYRKFLVEWLCSSTSAAPAHLLVITLDGAPLAALVFCVDNRCASSLIGSFDQAYRNLSPGSLGYEYVVKWAFDRKLDLDFGAGTERYKQFWSRRNKENIWTLVVATSSWGRIAMLAQSVRQVTLARTKVALPASAVPSPYQTERVSSPADPVPGDVKRI
jgi:CelD/BcsL family acetyltransferase involved in cellulose biosynthesis